MGTEKIPSALDVGNEVVTALEQAIRTHGLFNDPHLRHLANRLNLFVIAVDQELKNLKAHLPPKP